MSSNKVLIEFKNMNLLSTTRRDYKSWQPFATSTPLKKPPNLLKSIILPPKLLKPSEAVNVILNGELNSPIHQKAKITKQQNCPKSEKKIRKNRSSFFFEENLSSSEGEDEGIDNNQGIEIKIESKNVLRTKSIMKKRSSETSENKNNLVENKNQKIKLKTYERVNRQKKKLPEETNTVVKKSETKAENEIELIIDYQRNKENVKEGESKCQANDSINKSTNKNSKTLNSSKETKTVNNSLSDKKPVLKEVNNVRKSKIPQLQKSQRINKRKANASPAKQRKTKIVSKAKEEVKVISPLHIWDKKNKSHQLFSDSIELELINSLDLTKTDVDEKLQESSSENTPKSKDLGSVKKSLRQRKTPRPFWLPEIQKQEKLTNSGTRPLTGLKVNSEPDKDVKIDVVNSAIKPEVINTDSNSVGEKRKENEIAKAEAGDAEFKAPPTKMKRICQKKTAKVPAPTTRRTRRRVENENKELDVKENCKEEKKNEKNEEKISPTLATSSPPSLEFFKTFQQLSFQEGSQSGYLTSECWSLKHFKCGIFRVSSNSQVSSCTAFSNSYFGGVLIKGNLKMKIGTEETILKEGDSAWVPPLTDWMAFNVSVNDAIFYYWCGRFKT